MRKLVLFLAVTVIAFTSNAIAQKGPMTIGSISPDIKLGGYIQARYNWWQEDDTAGKTDDTFEIKRAMIWIIGEIAEKTNIMFTGFMTDGWMLLDAVGTYEVMPELKISVGQFLLPYSLEQLESSSVRPTLERSNASNALADHRDVGVMAEGALMDGLFGYGLAVVNGSGWSPNGVSKDNNDKKDIVARVWTKPFDSSEGPLSGLMVAGAFQTGEQPWVVSTVDPTTGTIVTTEMGDEQRTRYLGTILYGIDAFKFVGEYLYQDLEEQNVTSKGFYGTATYDFKVKGFCIQPVLKYEELDPDDSIDNDEQTITSFGVNTFLNPRSRITLQYQLIDETPEVDNNYFGVQVQFVF